MNRSGWTVAFRLNELDITGCALPGVGSSLGEMLSTLYSKMEPLIGMFK